MINLATQSTETIFEKGKTKTEKIKRKAPFTGGAAARPKSNAIKDGPAGWHIVFMAEFFGDEIKAIVACRRTSRLFFIVGKLTVPGQALN